MFSEPSYHPPVQHTSAHHSVSQHTQVHHHSASHPATQPNFGNASDVVLRLEIIEYLREHGLRNPELSLDKVLQALDEHSLSITQGLRFVDLSQNRRYMSKDHG